MSGTEEIGCCGACREYRKTCKGCKPGYLDGSRDLSRAKCRMKKCCLARGCVTCGEYESCGIIQSFLNHPGYKYGKYQRLWQIPRTGPLNEIPPAEHPWMPAGGNLYL